MSNIRELSQLASVIVVGNDTKNVGIGSTIPSSKLSVGGDAYISGIVTAVEFYGDGSNLTGIATFSGNYEDLSNKPSIPSDTSDLTNNAGFITAGSLVGYATETYVDLAVANLVDSSPSTLDTLNELAAALGDDPNFATTITNSLGNKANLSGATFTGIVTTPTLNVGSAVTITSNGIDAVGIITASGGFNLGISSAGSIITSGPIKTLNFIGAGNTFLIDGTTIDIGISGGGGGGSIGIGSIFPGTAESIDPEPSNGDLFFHIDYGRTFIYYDEVTLGVGSSAFWVDSSPFNQLLLDVENGGGGGSIGIGSVFPGTPQSIDPEPSNGDLFFHIDYGRTFIYYDEATLGVGSSASWIDSSPFNQSVLNPLSSIEFTSGSANTPSLYFTSDTSTGLFSPRSGEITIVSVGNSVFNANKSGVVVSGIVTATSFVKSGGTSSQFLKADGSIDSSTYLTSYTETQTLNNVLTLGNTSSIGMSVGVVTCTDLNTTSDINLKENIQTVNNALDIVNDLRGVRFEWKEDKRPSYGVIAQELEQILPELVTDTDPKTVNYNGIIGILIEGMKEQKLLIENLQSKIIYMENTLGISSSR